MPVTTWPKLMLGCSSAIEITGATSASIATDWTDDPLGGVPAHGAAAAAERLRRRRGPREVGGVRVGVGAAATRTYGGRCRIEGGRGGSAFVVGRRPVADEILQRRHTGAAAGRSAAENRGGVVDERDLAARRREIRRAGHVGRRERAADRARRAELHEEMAARGRSSRQAASPTRCFPRRSRTGPTTSSHRRSSRRG